MHRRDFFLRLGVERRLRAWGWGLVGALGLLGVAGRDGRVTAADSTVPTGLVPLTNMIRVSPGTFLRLGKPVTLTEEYWLGKFEVTQGEFAGVMGKNPSQFQDGAPSGPVEKVNFFEAVAFCDALTQRERAAGRLPEGYAYRLPTEAEWEFACRAGSTNRFSFGDDEAVAERFAWTLENAEGRPHPVGQKEPNALGFHDLHGNIWEWCSDWFTNYPNVAVTNPVGPPAGKFKVFRGGGWNNEAKFARASNRFMMEPARGIYFVGFRLALSRMAPTPTASR